MRRHLMTWLVVAASISCGAPAATTTTTPSQTFEQWYAPIRTNLQGVFATTGAVISALEQTKTTDSLDAARTPLGVMADAIEKASIAIQQAGPPPAKQTEVELLRRKLDEASKATRAVANCQSVLSCTQPITEVTTALDGMARAIGGVDPSLAAATITTARTTDTTEATTTTTTPMMEKQTYSGAGKQSVKLPAPIAGPVIATITNAGGDTNFIVEVQDTAGVAFDLAANAIGPYRGTALIDGSKRGKTIAFFDVTGNSSWTITVEDVRAAPSLDEAVGATYKGENSGVVRFQNTAAATIQIECGDCANNFTVQATPAGTGTAKLLANDIGAYSGSALVPSGSWLLEVGGSKLRGTAHWTLTVK